MRKKNKKYISSNKIPRNSLPIYHTTRNNFNNTRVNKITIARERVEMDLFKRGIKGHGRIKIKKIMAASAKNINLLRSDSEKVENVLEVCAVWKEWNGGNNADVPTKNFYIMYGWFDENPNWIEEMEADYMANNSVQYQNESETEQTTATQAPRKLNTIGMLISVMKNDCVK